MLLHFSPSLIIHLSNKKQTNQHHSQKSYINHFYINEMQHDDENHKNRKTSRLPRVGGPSVNDPVRGPAKKSGHKAACIFCLMVPSVV